MCSIIGFTTKELSAQSIRAYFDRTVSRGPDATRMATLPGAVLGFHRLSIMGLDERGMQPFYLGNDAVVCNGELYGFRQLREELSVKYSFKSESDCEIILPLYHEYRRTRPHRHPPAVLRTLCRWQHNIRKRGKKPRRPVR